MPGDRETAVERSIKIVNLNYTKYVELSRTKYYGRTINIISD